MAHYIVEVSPTDYEALQDLQHRLLSYDVAPAQAQSEMETILAKYLPHLPNKFDQTTILPRAPQTYSFGDT